MSQRTPAAPGRSAAGRRQRRSRPTLRKPRVSNAVNGGAVARENRKHWLVSGGVVQTAGPCDSVAGHSAVTGPEHAPNPLPAHCPRSQGLAVGTRESAVVGDRGGARSFGGHRLRLGRNRSGHDRWARCVCSQRNPALAGAGHEKPDREPSRGSPRSASRPSLGQACEYLWRRSSRRYRDQPKC